MNLPNSPNDWFFATKPTRVTLFLRTFVPYQLWRFLRINLKMFAMIHRSHKGGA
jgi:hypothetical protein